MEINFGLIAIHLAIYIALILILKKLYFDPVFAVLKKREALTQGKKESAEELKKEMEELKGFYSSEMQKLHSNLESKRQEALKHSREEANRVVQKTKRKNEDRLKAHQQSVEEQIEEVRRSLPDMGSHLGDDIIKALTTAKVVKV